MRAQRGRLGAASVLVLGLGAVAFAAGAAGGAEGGDPVVELGGDLVPVVEGDAGVTAVSLPVTLEPAASRAVTVHYETVDDTAVAGRDYVRASGTVTFPAGTTTRSIPLSVRGDATLEDHELFAVQLSGADGATLGRNRRRVQVQNDEIPVLVANPTRTREGRIAAFKMRLRQRYHERVTVQVVTRDGTARAPSDYAPKRTAIAFAPGTRGPITVNVSTKGDARVEPSETLALNAGAPGMLAAAYAIVDDGPLVRPPVVCPAGTIPTSPLAAAPSSPSTPDRLLPPAAVLGGEQWDLVFHDEFGDPAYTASKWSTGMRTGDRTLEANTELQWYLPENSVLTADEDDLGPVGVLQQELRRQEVPNRYYTARTLTRLYPPTRCPSLYRSGASTATASSNRAPTHVPFQFTSGMLNNAKSFGFRYGYVETRAKMPKGFALWPALWLRDWGDWRYEIDVLEMFDRQARVFRTGYWWGGGNNRGTHHDGGDIGITDAGEPCRHKVPLPATAADRADCSLAGAVDLSAGYHVIGLSWAPDGYDLYFDGVRRWSSPPGADVADTYQHLIVNLAFGNNVYEFDWTDEAVRPLHPDLFASSLFPKRTIEWDYVRVWQPHDSVDVCTPPNCR
jgi:beta-glucanase (GH16 family)